MGNKVKAGSWRMGRRATGRQTDPVLITIGPDQLFEILALVLVVLVADELDVDVMLGAILPIVIIIMVVIVTIIVVILVIAIPIPIVVVVVRVLGAAEGSAACQTVRDVGVRMQGETY